MDDLLKELISIDDGGGSSNQKQDRPSSPLRPNPKYCSMVQPASALINHSDRQRQQRQLVDPVVLHASALRLEAPRVYVASITSIAPRREESRQTFQGTATSSPSTSRVPAVQKEPTTSSGMEIDDDVQRSDRPSSPLRPNEKYCSIVPPSKPLVARVAPMSVVQPLRPPGLLWTPGDDYRFGSIGLPPHHNYRNPGLLNRVRDGPPQPAGYSNPHQLASHSNPHQQANYSNPHQQENYSSHHQPIDRSSPPLPSRSRRSPSYTEYSTPSRESQPSAHYSNHPHPSSHPPYTDNYARDRELARMLEIQEQKKELHNQEKRLAEDIRRRDAAEQAERTRIAMEEVQRIVEDRQREKTAEQELRRQEAERAKREKQERRLAEDMRRRDAAEQAKRSRAEEQERKRQDAERAKRDRDIAKSSRSNSTEKHWAKRNRTSDLNSCGDVKPQIRKEEVTVQMSMKEFEALKTQYQAEGEQKALAEAKKSETTRRRQSGFDQIDTRRNYEPEPMEVEESECVESSIPASSSRMHIAPIPLIIKAEPVQVPQPMIIDFSLDEIPLPPEPYVQGKEKDPSEQERKDEEKASKDDEDLLIIEKPPVELVDLSSDDDLGTVAAVSEAHTREIKQEDAESSKTPNPDDDDLWIVDYKRAARPKKHVFDPSKVKAEKEDESKQKISEETSEAASESKSSVPFNADRVKQEPADKGAGAKADTVPSSNSVKTEPTEEERTSYGPAPPLSQPALDEKEGGGDEPPQSSSVKAEECSEDRTTVVRSPSPPLPDYEEVVESTAAALGRSMQQHPIEDAQEIEHETIAAALVKARRLMNQETAVLIQIGEQLQSDQQQHRKIKLRRQPRDPLPDHICATNNCFVCPLRRKSRKRDKRWDADEDEEAWGVLKKRLRIEEEDVEDKEERERQANDFAILAHTKSWMK